MRTFPPVDDRPSLYSFVRTHLDEVGRLRDSGERLPDEVDQPGRIRWAPGALDGVLGHHAGHDERERARHLADAFVRACRSPTRDRLHELHEAVAGGDAVSHVDATLEQLAEAAPQRQRLHDLGRWLATTSPARDAVKIGLAVLGATGIGDDVDVVRVLGAHDEFTLYAAVALQNGLTEPDSELWALAAAVDGWGRIQCVERLRGTDDPAIRDWILRSGFRNSIMTEYLAHVAATTGGLLTALEDGEPDRELLTAAGEILEALVAGGPAQDLDDYDDGADAVAAFLGHLRTRAETLRDWHAVDAVRGWLADEAGDWDERATRGWTATRRTVLQEACEAVLADPAWDDRVAAALHSDDPHEFWLADQAARRRGGDTFDLHVAKVGDDPAGGPWFDAWQQAHTAERAERLVDLARRTLPLGELGSGAADELGVGPGWQQHSALGWTLQALRDHPGTGGDLLLVGLRSPVVRNRNMALNALERWVATWPEGAEVLVDAAARTDPQPATRDRAREVLDGRAGA